jgi:hypothetical protein
VELHDFEGMVAKRLESPYQRGRSGDWLKVKYQNYSRPPLSAGIAAATASFRDEETEKTKRGLVLQPCATRVAVRRASFGMQQRMAKLDSALSHSIPEHWRLAMASLGLKRSGLALRVAPRPPTLMSEWTQARQEKDQTKRKQMQCAATA